MSSIVFFDIDNTIIRGQSQQLLVKYLFKKRMVSILFLLKLYLWFFLYKLNLVKDPLSVMEYSFKLIKDWPTKLVDKTLKDFFDIKLKNYIYSDMIKTINNHLRRGDHVFIISNIIYPLARIIAQYLGIRQVIATRLEIINNKYTGRLQNEIVYGTNKVKLAKEFIEKNNLSLKKSYSYADHLSDLAILELADNPVVVNPDNKLSTIALKKSWKIIKFN